MKFSSQIIQQIGNKPSYKFGSLLKDRMKEVIAIKQQEFANLKKEHGETVIGQYTLGQTLGGMRGISGLYQDVSKLDANKGISIRGFSIPQLSQNLPAALKNGEALPEGLWWLLNTGEVPNQAQFQSIVDEWKQRGKLAEDVVKFIQNLPKELHSMTMLSMAILYLQKNSVFAKAYANKTANKKNYWEFYYEDAMNLSAQLPRIAALIYRHKFYNGKLIPADESLDWGANYSHMLGYDSEVMYECFRGYLTMHCDHEGGNVSAHSTHLVGSALSDAYLSYSAGINGLAGPLHGLANQEVLDWILQLKQSYGNSTNISKEQIAAFVHKSVGSGSVVPGYGHAVLRATDPRFTHQKVFAKKYLPNNDLIKLVHLCEEVIPETLKAYPKIKNPFPNVDAHSGVLLYSLGIREYEYYTVVFGVSRALGCLSWLTWARAYGLPIERPGSIDTNWIQNKFKK